jgi:hypothetical protein
MKEKYNMKKWANRRFDWTFQVVKNYILPGAKAMMFTMNKGSTKKIVHLGMVRSTAASQISHLVTKAKEKQTMFSSKALYSDITPHHLPFWMSVFGPRIMVLLGLFHCMHCVVDTLDPMSLLYWQVLLELKDYFYRYVEEDFRRLRQCLMEGRLGEGKPMMDSDISNLQWTVTSVICVAQYAGSSAMTRTSGKNCATKRLCAAC